MAKNDYFIIVYKILKYLYKCLKSSESISVSYLSCETKDFPVTQEYWEYIIEHMIDDDLIDGPNVCRSDTGFTMIKCFQNIRITPIGIEYLQENNMMKKAADAIKDLASLIP